MASLTTNRFRFMLLRGASGSPALNLEADTIKVALIGTGYTPDPDHNFMSQVNANELSGTGYVSGFAGSGRKTLASKTVTQDDGTNIAYFDAADFSGATVWSAINAGTIAYLAIYRHSGADTTSELLVVVDVTDLVTNGSDVAVQWAADGICKLS